MVRSSQEQRPESNWAATNNRNAQPRIVRLGRPANDNHRRPVRLVHVLYLVVASALALIAILNWTIF